MENPTDHFQPKPKTTLFHRDYILVVTAWPHLRAYQMTRKTGLWRCVRPWLDLDDGIIFPQRSFHRATSPRLGPVARDAIRKRVADWTTHIPTPVVGLINRFSGRTWHLLVAAAKVPGWVELASSAPVLAFAIANCWTLDGQSSGSSLRRMRRYVTMTRSRAWTLLGFPDFARILEKIPMIHCSLLRLLMLRTTLPHAAHLMKALSHEKTLQLPLLNLLSSKRHLAVTRPKWISYFNHLESPLSDLEYTRIGQFLPFLNTFAPPACYQDLDAWLNRRGIMRIREAGGICEETFKTYPEHYPDPPVPGDDNIQPLTSMGSAEAEATEMHHCLAALKSQPHYGKRYFYRMLRPERATIELVWNLSSLNWEIGQIHGYKNAPVKSDSLAAAQRWSASKRATNLRQGVAA